MQPMTQHDAEVFAAQALAWIAADEALLAGFLGWSGMAPETLRRGLSDPDILLSVLDFLLLDDATVLAFCAHQSTPPETIWRARGGLPGGKDMHWT